MSYVRSLWVVGPITMVMVGVALCFAWTAAFAGRQESFQAALPKAFLAVAVLGMCAALLGGGSASASRAASRFSVGVRSGQLHDDGKPGEVSLSPGAACFISSAMVAVIAFLIS